MSSVSLPSDLVIEIMSRVPCKSLARFQSVSKQFKSLLSDPCFHRLRLRLRLHHSRSRDALFTLKSVRYKRTYNFFVTNEANGLVHQFNEDFGIHCISRMLSSHHQLLCFVCEYGIYLCDPVNKYLKNLTYRNLSTPYFNYFSGCRVSFGFVDATMQYKVVKWPQNLDEERTRRLPSGLITTWKKLKLKFEVLTIDVDVGSGCVKVSPGDGSIAHVPIFYNSLLRFTSMDLSTGPPVIFKSCLSLYKMKLSSPNLWMIDYDVPSKIMEIWKMEASRGGWAKIHKIDLGETHANDNDGKVEMLDIRSDQVLFNQSWKKLLICYDANTNTLKKYETECRDYDHMCHFTDGLLSIHNLNHNSN